MLELEEYVMVSCSEVFIEQLHYFGFSVDSKISHKGANLIIQGVTLKSLDHILGDPVCTVTYTLYSTLDYIFSIVCYTDYL